jgi:hypothetical protein
MANPTQIIVEPWCGQGTEGTDYVIPPQSSPDPTVVTQNVGLPSVQSEPLAAGGTLTQRYDWNGALYLYSSILAQLQQGYTYTANASVISANGGYFQGSILNQFLNVGGIVLPQLQVSLINNNTNNFVTTPSFANDGVNWLQITNPVQSDFNRKNNIGNANIYTISITDGFSAIENDGTSIVYTLPNPTTLPQGFTVCITNQTGSITDGTSTITMTNGNSNRYYKCEVNSNLWVIDNQEIANYSPWATQGWVATNGYNEATFITSSTWTCPANVTRVFVWLVGGGGGGGGGANRAGGGGGGMGSIFIGAKTVVPGTVYTVTCGAGGTANTGGNGNAGGTTSFGSLASTTGGSGGGVGGLVGELGGTPGDYAGNAGHSPDSSGNSGPGGTGGSGGWVSFGGKGGFASLDGSNGSYGGGGGGGGGNTPTTTTGGVGGVGAVTIRW